MMKSIDYLLKAYGMAKESKTVLMTFLFHLSSNISNTRRSV